MSGHGMSTPAGVKRGARDLGIGGHHVPHHGGKDEWLTPPEIIKALGPFDLDPCAPIVRPWPTATRHLTIEDDGLAAEWPTEAFVWCNPPYGPNTWYWLAKLSRHDGGGIALTFARTETRGFFKTAWYRSDAMLFIEGRLHFHHVSGARAAHNAGGPSVLMAYGAKAVARLKAASGLRGALVERGDMERFRLRGEIK